MRTGRPPYAAPRRSRARRRRYRAGRSARVCAERPAVPRVREEARQTVDGVDIRRLRWSVGYGPDTTGWLLRPTGVAGDLPAVLGMHCHGGVRSMGGEQLVELAEGAHPRAAQLRQGWYSGRAPANELARQGFVVLVHDTFSWGSRRFDLSHPTPRLAATLGAYAALWREQGLTRSPDEQFDLASGLHEDTLAKAAGALGQTFAGAVLTDDLVALDVLAEQPGVDSARLSTFGFSGGGGRSLLLAALDHRVGASVVACMMATFSSLVPSHLDCPLVAAAHAGSVVLLGLAGPDPAGPGPLSRSVPDGRSSLSRRRDGGRPPPAHGAASRARALPRHLPTRRPRVRRRDAGRGDGLLGPRRCGKRFQLGGNAP